MTLLRRSQAKQGLSVLLVDSDPGFLSRSCKLIAEDGHNVWGAEDLIAAASFLADQLPDVLLVEVALLEMDGADPLADLRECAPAAPIILMGPGAPGAPFRKLNQLHNVFGFHDKRHGEDGLRLWVNAALATARQLDAIRRTRQGLRRLLETAPELHEIQNVDELMETILDVVSGLMGGDSAFVAARSTDLVGKPPIEGFIYSPQSIDDFVVSAASSDVYPKGSTVEKLRSVPNHLFRRAVEERCNIIDDRHGVLPLVLERHVLGLAYISRPGHAERDIDLLQLFASQAAAAIRNAALYELATVDSTTRVFQKSFILERLRETVKLAWRKAFPVTVLMLDIDRFKDLNDKYGHVVGDRALRHLGNLLKMNVRDSDVVGRFGGDEFLLILIDANQEGGVIVAERLHSALASQWESSWPPGMPQLTTTVGLAALEPGDASPMDLGIPDFAQVVEQLVSEADAAMYRAQHYGLRFAEGRKLRWPDFIGS
ncbi:MAG: diguanylate cyclase [Gemmatimonadota bacterium]|nr:MAG: diguanylate cyclase [Gemmatimonadota bacterium]